MKENSAFRSASFIKRGVLAVALCSIGVLMLAMSSWSKSVKQTPAMAGAARANGKTAPAQTNHPNADLTYRVIPTLKSTFGYDIFAAGKLAIHQTNIPAVPGNEGFKTQQDAKAVASLVIEKIKKSEMPPTISVDELRTLKVIQ